MPIAEQQRSVVHSTFSLERTYPASRERVFAAFANQETKRRWFVEGEGWQVEEYTADFRVGGREHARFRFEGGPPVENHTTYFDIVAEQRIVFAYSMVVGGARISASLATVELAPAGAGTQLIYTEQGAFFDGADQPAQREVGCRELLEQLAKELASH